MPSASELPKPQQFVNLGSVEADNKLVADVNHWYSLPTSTTHYIAGGSRIAGDIDFLEADASLPKVSLDSPAKPTGGRCEDDDARLFALGPSLHSTVPPHP
jgi:hypothetical protein